LRHDVNGSAVLGDRDERRRRREVAIPEIVLHRLEVPDALARRGAQAEDRVGEEVVAVAVGAVEVIGRRARGRVQKAALLVERDARPGVGAATVLPRAFRPGVVAELARVRDGVECPLLRAGVDVERTDVAGR
jgi:hypothetical protein